MCKSLQDTTEASGNHSPVEKAVDTHRSEDHSIYGIHEIVKFSEVEKPCHPQPNH